MYEDFLFKHKIKSNKGCLVDALAIRGDEGRERLRKVRVSRQYALTPEFPNGETQSLWIIFDWIHRSKKQTRRSETSQYPQEKKATAIPLVVASETGPAQ